EHGQLFLPPIFQFAREMCHFYKQSIGSVWTSIRTFWHCSHPRNLQMALVCWLNQLAPFYLIMMRHAAWRCRNQRKERKIDVDESTTGDNQYEAIEAKKKEDESWNKNETYCRPTVLAMVNC